MILFTILMIILITLTIITVLAISFGGAVFIVLFADVIVCIALIVWIIKRLIKR